MSGMDRKAIVNGPTKKYCRVLTYRDLQCLNQAVFQFQAHKSLGPVAIVSLQ